MPVAPPPLRRPPHFKVKCNILMKLYFMAGSAGFEARKLSRPQKPYHPQNSWPISRKVLRECVTKTLPSEAKWRASITRCSSASSRPHTKSASMSPWTFKSSASPKRSSNRCAKATMPWRMCVRLKSSRESGLSGMSCEVAPVVLPLKVGLARPRLNCCRWAWKCTSLPAAGWRATGVRLSPPIQAHMLNIVPSRTCGRSVGCARSTAAISTAGTRSPAMCCPERATQ